MKISAYSYTGVKRNGTFSDGKRGAVATNKSIENNGSYCIRFNCGRKTGGTLEGVTIFLESDKERADFLKAVERLAK